MHTKKVILIHVGNFCEYKPAIGIPPPIGIIYLATYLSAREFNVIIIDTRCFDKNSFYVYINKMLPDALLVGLSVMTPLVKEGLEITDYIKSLFPSLPVVWGGYHATLYPESTIAYTNIDYCIVDEGEQGLLSLANVLCNKKNLIDVTNLFWKKENAIIQNEVSLGENLDTIGIPAYQLFDYAPYYVEKSTFTQRTKIDILTSRGCNARCAFCVNSIIHKNRWRHESMSQTLLNLDAVIARYHAAHICFADEDFFCDQQRLKYLLPEIKKRNITWDANCRADHLRDSYLDDETLSLMYDSGCRGLRFGLESGSQRVLDLLHKGLTPQQSLHAIRQSLKHGIIPNASFMMGIPDETREDVLKTLALILSIRRINQKIDILGPQIFRPYPGSVLFNKCVEKGLRLPQTLHNWSNFFIYNNVAINKENYPWFSQPTIFHKALLWRQYLEKKYPPFWLRYLLLMFHIKTKLYFINFDYVTFKFIKSVIRKI
jgi:anaerobic magnesium-protoporphyrin IX monomethyl ester cyclase